MLIINDKQRFFIDALKGVAVFLMLWGHCIQYCLVSTDLDFFENSLFKIIYSFHMPLFMLISGYLFFFSFSKRNLKDLLIHRVQNLVQPIVFGTIFNFLVTTVLFGLFNGEYWTIISAKWVNSLSSLWFLWSVLAASIAVALACNICKKIFPQLLMLLLFIVIVAIFPNFHMNLYMYPYFVAGFYFAKYKEKISIWVYKIRHLSIIIFPIMMLFFEKKHYIYTTGLYDSSYSFFDNIAIHLYRWGIGFLGSIFAVTVLYFIYEKIVLKFGIHIFFSGVSKLGKKSLQVYIVSVSLLFVYLPIGM